MIRKYLYITGLILCFGAGAYIWKISHPGQKRPQKRTTYVAKTKYPTKANLVYVGTKAITAEDLDWEFSLHTEGIFEAENLTPIPDLGSHYEKELAPLKERLMAGIIERKMLFQYIQQDSSFKISDASRYISCMKEFQDTVQDAKELIVDQLDQERLKMRLCEKSILEQYFEERIAAKIKIKESEVIDFYKKNMKKFNKPARVVIRQIVLAEEKEAKRARYGLRRANFASRAKKLSITPEAKNGGLLGPFAKGELPRVFDVAFGMRRGEIRGILKSTYGFHLIMLEKKLPKVKLSLAEATPKIREHIYKQKQEEEYKKWVEIALNTIPIKTPNPFY